LHGGRQKTGNTWASKLQQDAKVQIMIFTGVKASHLIHWFTMLYFLLCIIITMLLKCRDYGDYEYPVFECTRVEHGERLEELRLGCTSKGTQKLCKIWGFHGCGYEECRLLTCYAEWLRSVLRLLVTSNVATAVGTTIFCDFVKQNNGIVTMWKSEHWDCTCLTLHAKMHIISA
jgi:hypothetical protein